MSGLSQLWQEAIGAYLAILLDKTADYNSGVCRWHISGEKIGNTFTRFALPIIWDFVELAVINDVGGATMAQLEWEVLFIQHSLLAASGGEPPIVINQSSKQNTNVDLDVIVTDPPYYDAIPYSDCMDFFHVWIRRTLHGLNPAFSKAFAEPLSPKWNHETDDGEMIDDCSRHDGNRHKSKQAYEDGMANVFRACHQSLKPEGCLVVVFAHKHPDAWETLMSAIIKSGFVADACWPIQTEMSTRMRAKSSAALSSSVWLVCKKRPITAKPGWDNRVLEDMRANISVRLREYWDAGIRGPDFVWAATGPALEAYSKHPVVKKANDAGQIMTVGEFLTHVRRMVVDFVVGQVLTGPDKDGVSDMDAADRMDAPTSYYLLHRNDFGFDEAPSGACILYATACGLSDRDLETTWNMLARKGSSSNDEDEEDADPDDDSTDESSDSGSKVKLKTWAQRNSKSMGYDAPGGQTIPLIDRVHRLMHLWKSGDVHKVDEYLDDNGLRRQELFGRLLQSLIELSPAGSEERSLLESLSNHTQAKGSKFDDGQMKLFALEVES
ncbi:MAG: DUF1156 domain-containing protein [Planctomycetes bacterium]|nr:DUF1156 domain-containing protein [Planctomycetota bacterium]